MSPGDPTSAAIRAAREEPTPEGWFRLSDDIMRRVRRIVRPTVPMIAFSPDGSAEHGPRFSRILVAGRVLIAVLRRRMERSALRLEKVDLEVVDDRLVAAIVTITGDYGDELRETAERARAETLSCVKEILGDDPRFTAASIDVFVTDIVETN